MNNSFCLYRGHELGLDRADRVLDDLIEPGEIFLEALTRHCEQTVVAPVGSEGDCREQVSFWPRQLLNRVLNLSG